MVDATNPPSFWERTFSPEIRKAYNLDRTAQREAERAASAAERGLGEANTRMTREVEGQVEDLNGRIRQALDDGDEELHDKLTKDRAELRKRLKEDRLRQVDEAGRARLSADRSGTPNLANVRAQRAARRAARAAKLRTFFRGGVTAAAGIGLGFAVNAYRNAQKRAAAGDPEAQAQSDQLMRFLNGEDMAPDEISALASSMPDNFSDLTELRDRALQDGVRAGDAIRETTPPEDIEEELGEDVQALESGIDPRDLDDEPADPNAQPGVSDWLRAIEGLRNFDPQAQGAGLDVGGGPERIFDASFTPGGDGFLGSAPAPQADITDVDLSPYRDPTALQDIPSEFNPTAFQAFGALEGPGAANEYRTAVELQDARNQSGAEFDAGLAGLVDDTIFERPVLNARIGADQGPDPNAGFWESMFPRADQVASGVYGAARGAYNFADETGALDLVRPLWRELLREGGATPLIPDAGAQPLPQDDLSAAARAQADMADARGQFTPGAGMTQPRGFDELMDLEDRGVLGVDARGRPLNANSVGQQTGVVDPREVDLIPGAIAPVGTPTLPPMQGPDQQSLIERAIDSIVSGDEIVYPRGQDIRERDQGGDGGLPQLPLDGMPEFEASAEPRLGFGAAQAATLGGGVDQGGYEPASLEDTVRDNPMLAAVPAGVGARYLPGAIGPALGVAGRIGLTGLRSSPIGAAVSAVIPSRLEASTIPEDSPYYTPSPGQPARSAPPAPVAAPSAPAAAPPVTARQPLTFSEADLSDNARMAEAEINPVRSGGRSGPLPTASEAPDPDDVAGEAPELNAINRYMRDTLGLDDDQRARAAELLLDFGGRLANTPGNFAQGFTSAAAGTGATARDLSRSDAEMGLAEQELQMRQDAARRDAALDSLRQRKLEMDVAGGGEGGWGGFPDKEQAVEIQAARYISQGMDPAEAYEKAIETIYNQSAIDALIRSYQGG